MNIKAYLFRMRKRIGDNELVKIQTIVNDEVKRRTEAIEKSLSSKSLKE
jgi:hypothetical protein